MNRLTSSNFDPAKLPNLYLTNVFPYDGGDEKSTQIKVKTAVETAMGARKLQKYGPILFLGNCFALSLLDKYEEGMN